jgi:hypothetical protein
MMNLIAASTSYVDWSSMWKILVIGLGAGAGLAVVYSLGLVALSASGYLPSGVTGTKPQRNVFALVGAIVCLLVVLAAAAYGISVIFTK